MNLPDNPVVAFALCAAAMIAVALLHVLPRLWKGARPASTPTDSEANAAIYRRELAELDAAVVEGTLVAGESAQARAELERRLLSDIADTPVVPATAGGHRRSAIAIAALLPLAALALYAVLGNPAVLAGSADAGIGTGRAPPSRDALLRHLERSPRDARAWVLLARTDAAADRFADAATAFDRAVSASTKVAADPGIWCEYADALGMAQGGRLAGRPREFVMRALSIDPMHSRALEMAGSAAYEAREFAAAARYWRQLAPLLPEGSASRQELAAAISRVERLATMSRELSIATPQ